MEIITAMGIPLEATDIDAGALLPEDGLTASSLYGFTRAITADAHDLQNILKAETMQAIVEIIEVVVQRRPPDHQGLDFTLESE